MSRVRILIVDDSVVVRRVLSDVLGAEPWIEVVGTAANGRIALQKLLQLAPDLVTLDVEMPELDGLETLVEIRRTHPKLPVIMFSSLTERAATTTLEALSRGATDYATKPESSGGIVGASADIRAQLLPKIRALFRDRQSVVPLGMRPSLAPARSTSQQGRSIPVVSLPGTLRSGPRAPYQLLAIGGSTGGPNALASVFAKLPPLDIPIVVTQHMPPLFTRLLAERLSSQSKHRVIEAKGDEVVEAGFAYVAPGDHHLLFATKSGVVRTVITKDPPENSCRPAVDPMFRSAVAAYGGAILGVVLTGMGQDGLRGSEGIRAAGGQVIVQDEASSVVWGMPGYVARAGLADAVLPLDDLPREIVRRLAAAASSFARVESLAPRAREGAT